MKMYAQWQEMSCAVSLSLSLSLPTVVPFGTAFIAQMYKIQTQIGLKYFICIKSWSPTLV
jgi:hypothetical protein